jgi:GAF domain-containing protein
MSVTHQPPADQSEDLTSAYRVTRAAAAGAERWLEDYRRRASRTMSQPQLDRLLRDALASIARILDADAASLLFANDEGTELVGRVAYGLPQEVDLEVTVPAGAGASGPILATGEPRFIDDLQATVVISDVLRQSGQRSYVGVPVQSRGRRFGVLHATRLSVRPFAPEDAELLQTFAEPMAAAVERVELFAAERAARRAAEEATAQARRATLRVRGLQSVTAALASAATIDQICRIIVEHVVPGSEQRGERAIWMLRDGRLVLMAGSGEAARFPEIPLDDSLPAAATLEDGKPHFVETRGEVTGRWPVLASSSTAAFAALPLVAEDRRVGLMAIGFPEDHLFEPDERDYLVAIAEQAALALSRAESQARLAETRRLAEERGEQLDFLAEASDRLNRSLDLDLTLATVADLAVPRLTDRCALYLLEGDQIEKRVIAPSALTADEWELFNRSEQSLQQLTGVGAVIRTGVPQYVREIDPATAAAVPDAGARALLERVGFGGLLILPLRARGRNLGALAFVNRRGRPMEEGTAALAEELAARAAVALDNAEMFRREAHVARELVESLLPSRLPEVEGLEVAVSFHPAGGGPEVGGDFYDVIALGADTCLLAVGDVQGKGIEAAALTGLLRAATKTAAHFTTRPMVILDHLNTTIIDNIVQRARSVEHPWDDARLCTAAVVRMERRRQRWRVSAATAGHPPPLLRRVDGSVEPVCRPSMMLGVDPSAAYVESSLWVEPGDTMVLFTDGLTESRLDGAPLGQEGASAVLRDCADSAFATTERMAGVALSSPGRHDDLVVLTVRAKQRH